MDRALTKSDKNPTFVFNVPLLSIVKPPESNSNRLKHTNAEMLLFLLWKFKNTQQYATRYIWAQRWEKGSKKKALTNAHLLNTLFKLRNVTTVIKVKMICYR